MTPAELRKCNIAHFQRLLGRITEPDERARIERLVEEERAKPDTAYPVDRAATNQR
jgi:hypothetical protein